MSYQVPGYLMPYVLSGALAVLAAVPAGLYAALKRAGWPARERRQVVWTAAGLLAAWFLAALLLSWFGFYQPASGPPTLQYGLLLPIVAGIALYWLWPKFKSAVAAIPQEWMAGLQTYRTLGLIFLVLYAGGFLPGVFAWPAGAGDAMVGVLAPAVAIAYARKSRNSARWLRAWNLLGIGDLTVAITTGFLSSPSPLQMFAFDLPNRLITAFPLALIPVFIVPLSLLLHLASLDKLRHTEVVGKTALPTLEGVRSTLA